MIIKKSEVNPNRDLPLILPGLATVAAVRKALICGPLETVYYCVYNFLQNHV